MSAGRYVEVAVDAPAGWGRTFSYSVPLSMTLEPGQMVTVPFGPRLLHGIVFEVTDSPQVEQVRDVAGLVEAAPRLSDERLEVARWISSYYLAPLFEAAAPMLPPGFRSRAQAFLSLIPGVPEPGDLAPGEVKLLAYLRPQRRPVAESRLEQVLGGWALRAARGLVRRGMAERRWVWPRPRVGPSYDSYLRLALPAAQAQALAGDLERRAPRRAALLRALAEAQGVSMALTEARRRYGTSAVSGLLARQAAMVGRVERRRDPLAGLAVVADSPPALTPAQAGALSAIWGALEDGSRQPRTFLLHGVTGSGKTEVYLRALARCVELGKRGLVLVPEISLTPQAVQRFSARFPRRVAVLHSGLSPGEQFDQWWRTAQGEYDVVIGSRGAVFAPQPDLGLIVIDEEHEWTYKQHDVSPRYHAREVALRLGELTGAVVVLGGATPDVCTYHACTRGQYGLLELPHRLGEEGQPTPLARVDVVDMRRELKEGNRSIFSRALRGALEECLRGGNQAILFLNRRGAATTVQCRDCGHVLCCPGCAVSYTYHASGTLVCHWCGRRRRPPASCPGCHGRRIRYLGLGTQRVVEEVEGIFSGVRVLRWDRDTATSWRDHQLLMERFGAGKANVLVGTQMVAKSLHLPQVTLVGVVLADIGLHLPDYRAGERIFQVLCQVAGRAGRGREGGRVVVQTYAPHHYAVAAGALQDYAAFYEQELAYRRVQGDPPFGRLIRLLYSHSSEEVCQRQAQGLAGALRTQARVWGIADVDIIGPAPAYPPRLRGRHRWHLILRGADPGSLLRRVDVPAGWVVDVDPASVL